ncbi:hypothetical protein J2Z21_000549 [Streptomyces griseochromogenes]|uniref:Transposase n=1 Tax=Streptomyces griseochromogenes TaxID=68214 RepID=A0ABS4LK12_9ACTN|nr:hypothetical protein [Streptomyces griseochromogenes]MBP2047627.1 hypothetical protein [Streptomyces griseochromogenes]
MVLYLRWCLRTGRDWRVAATDMGLFMVWLKYVPAGAEDQQVVRGPGTQPVRGERRINKVLTAVRGFLAFAIGRDEAPPWILGQIYDLADSRDLPLEAQAEDARLTTGCGLSTGCTSLRRWSTGPPTSRPWPCSGPAGRPGTA